MTEILVMRHGQARCSKQGVVGGPIGCTGLTDAGRDQAHAFASYWREHAIVPDVVYTSTLPRALETASYIEAEWKVTARPDERLCEVRPGDADGMRFDELEERFRSIASLGTDSSRAMAPGGESLDDFHRRMAAFFEHVVELHRGQRVLLVAHAGVIESSFQWRFGANGKAIATSIYSQPTSVTTWRNLSFDPAVLGTWYLAGHNQLDHLPSKNPGQPG